MIVALAGRRVDAADAAQPRFPCDRTAIVETRVDAALQNAGASALVCSAACGADLIAVAAARRRGVDAWIVLPYAVAAFRRSSVVDRGNGWGDAFDAAVDEARQQGRLRILGLPVGGERTFHATNTAIVDTALSLAAGVPEAMLAIAVWDGPLAERTDYTADFVDAARGRGVTVASVPILEP